VNPARYRRCKRGARADSCYADKNCAVFCWRSNATGGATTGRNVGKVGSKLRTVSQKTCISAHCEPPTVMGVVWGEFEKSRESGLMGRFLRGFDMGASDGKESNEE